MKTLFKIIGTIFTIISYITTILAATGLAYVWLCGRWDEFNECCNEFV